MGVINNFAILSASDGGNSLFTLVFSGCLFVYLVYKVLMLAVRTKRVDHPLPPGPKPLPLIGNVLNMPTKEPWNTFARWSAEYGEVVYVSVFNQSIIILNSPKAVNDLLEKRSAIYSDRPRLPLVAEMTGLVEWNFNMMSYNDTWRKYRRVFSSRFGPGTVHMFHPAQEFASVTLLKLLLDDPEGFRDHIRLCTVQDIMMSTYGIIPKTRDNSFVVLAEQTLTALSRLLQPGLHLADIFPILKKVPSWVPGASSQKLARQMAKGFEDMRDVPFVASREMMSSGTMPMPCFISDLLEDQSKNVDDNLDPDLERITGDCALQAYGGGSDTSVAQLTSFILAMTLNPTVQKKAQGEIDQVVGSSRLPTLEDQKNLPYVTAVMKEVLRWHVTVPQTPPHMLKEDDVYEGYFLPKGSIVIGNSWEILHNPELYIDPMEFKPERFINSEGALDLSKNDPAKFAFGYGRRICPGRFFAENALQSAICKILATFDILPAKDENGELVPVEHRPSNGLISHPSAFRCVIAPRSDEAAALIQQANENMLQMYKV